MFKISFILAYNLTMNYVEFGHTLGLLEKTTALMIPFYSVHAGVVKVQDFVGPLFIYRFYRY